MKNGLFRVGAIMSVALAGMLLSGCISVKRVDEEQLPVSWRQSIEAVVSQRDLNGVYRGSGEIVGNDGVPKTARLADVFFPGLLGRREIVDTVQLAFDAGKLTVVARRGQATTHEGVFDAAVEPKTGWLKVASIPVKDTNKFGAVATTQSARLALGKDGALYIKVNSLGAGVVLFMPAVGNRLVWGRWEKPPAVNGVRSGGG